MEEKVKNHYLLGIIGALVGAFIGAIPWVLVYVFANVIYSILAILIVICGFYGYKLTKATIDKKLPIILSITSFISITVTVFIIIPACLMIQSNMSFSISNLLLLYQYDVFSSAIIEDYVVSLLFCLIVIGVVIYNLNKQIREDKDSKDIKIIAQDLSNDSFSNDDIDKVREIFEKNNAINKHQTITEELIMEDLNKEFGEEKAKAIFQYLKLQEVIKKKSNKYYFSEKAQKSVWYRYGITNIKTFVIVIIIAAILACIVVFTQNNSTNNVNEIQDIASSDVERETRYEIGEDDIYLDFSNDIIMLTDEEIEDYFGEEYLSLYDCIAITQNFSKMVMVFTEDKSNYDEDYTAEEYFKMSLDDDEIEIEEKEISGHTFYTYELTYEGTDGNTYAEQDIVYEAEDKFICIIIDTVENEKIDASEIIK